MWESSSFYFLLQIQVLKLKIDKLYVTSNQGHNRYGGARIYKNQNQNLSS